MVSCEGGGHAIDRCIYSRGIHHTHVNARMRTGQQFRLAHREWIRTATYSRTVWRPV